MEVRQKFASQPMLLELDAPMQADPVSLGV